MKEKIRIGTRGSKLALAQTQIVVELLRAHAPTHKFEVVPIKTIGDLLPPEKRGDVDAKSAFTTEIENHLLKGNIDLAVHSLKDLPNDINPDLSIVATPKRGDARDALVTGKGISFSRLPRGSTVGTGSVRRRVQLLQLRSDLKVVDLHGNIETRLRKMSDSGLDGVVLAYAGLSRIGLGERVSYLFTTDEMIPAISQGTLAVEARREDSEIYGMARSLDDEDTRLASSCERAFSSRLGGDCHVPIAAFARVGEDSIEATGMIASIDGRRIARDRLTGERSSPEKTGERLADNLLQKGGAEIKAAAR